jgi:hypothetical protein
MLKKMSPPLLASKALVAIVIPVLGERAAQAGCDQEP